MPKHSGPESKKSTFQHFHFQRFLVGFKSELTISYFLKKGCGFKSGPDHFFEPRYLHRQKFDKVGIRTRALPVPHKQLIFVLEM